MIHRFCVSNYRSIREKVELDLRIPKTTPDLPRFRRSPADPDIRLPTVAVLIGHNGSGKTTLLRAIDAAVYFMWDSISSSGETIPHFSGFQSQEYRSEPTHIEIDFDAAWLPLGSGQSSLYSYILELHRDEDSSNSPTRVGYEILHMFPKGRRRMIFERCGEKPIRVAEGLGLRRKDDRLASIPSNASVISFLAKLGVEPFVSMAKDFKAIHFQSNIFPSNILGDNRWPGEYRAVKFYRDNPDLIESISDSLPYFDLGIKDMKLHESPKGPTIGFGHHGLDEPVVIQEESTGTRHVVRMFPLIYKALEVGNLATMDDFDADLHTELAVEIVGWFQSKEHNPRGAQLICSSHNLALLDDLEKEEVFIAEKDRDGATHAYGVRQIAGVQRSEDLRKLYRGGVLGGLPTFG